MAPKKDQQNLTKKQDNPLNKAWPSDELDPPRKAEWPTHTHLAGLKTKVGPGENR